ncbi:MAG TPA: protein kinase, partial [Polyangiaceae bacterium]
DGAVERFLREAQATAALRSPHVVQVLDYGVDGDQPFIVMELLEGENLADRIERVGPLPPLEVLRIVTHVARAMGKAHELGIVHRDLKPENIFLVVNGDEEVAKVLDFGVAKIASPVDLNQDTYTITGSLIGTPYYMSPEQAQGNKAVDHRSDLWALGVIAFEMITAKRPFDGDALGDLVLTICVRSIAVPSAVAQVPAGFDAWFAKAVEREPAARFQSAREMALALLQIIEGDTDIRYTRTEELASVASASPIAEIPSRPNASAFAVTMRDDTSLGASSLLSPSPPRASTTVGATQTVGTFAGAATATNFPLPGELVEEEQLTPWSLAGIAALALAAGAAAVYGLFFLFRAHEASNDSSDAAASALRPAATVVAPAAAKHHFDVATTHRPNGNTENPPPKSPRALREPSSALPPAAASAVGTAINSVVPSTEPIAPPSVVPVIPAPLEPEAAVPPSPNLAPLPMPGPQNLAPDSAAPTNPGPAFSAEPQPMAAPDATNATPTAIPRELPPREVHFGAIAPD